MGRIDTLFNTDIYWERTTVTVPLFRSDINRSKKVSIKNKTKTICIAGAKYTFFSPTKLYGSETFIVACQVTHKGKTYVQNIALGAGSQLQFSNIILEVQQVNSNQVILKYRTN